jgi:hypothetical protein
MYYHHMCDVCQHYGWNFISSRLCKIFGGLLDGQSNYARQALLNRLVICKLDIKSPLPIKKKKKDIKSPQLN